MHRSAPLAAAVRPSRKYYYIDRMGFLLFFFFFLQNTKNFEQRSRARVTWKNERKINYISYSYPFLTTIIIIMTNNINIASNGSGRSFGGFSSKRDDKFYLISFFPPDPNDAAPRSTVDRSA